MPSICDVDALARIIADDVYEQVNLEESCNSSNIQAAFCANWRPIFEDCLEMLNVPTNIRNTVANRVEQILRERGIC